MSSKPAHPGHPAGPRAGSQAVSTAASRAGRSAVSPSGSQPWAEAWSRSAMQCAALPVRLGSEALRSPFDALRWAHAASARAGWVPRSLRESASFEQALMALERALLGPLARRR